MSGPDTYQGQGLDNTSNIVVDLIYELI
jgi:hypothetical protein